MGEISVKTGNNARNGGKNSLNRLIRCVCGKKIGPDPRNFNQRVSLGRNDLLIRTFPNSADVVLMDMNMPGIGGLEATRKIARSVAGTKVIMLTVHTENPLPAKVMQAGAAGYLSKGAAPQEVVNAIRCVASGQRYIASDIAQQMALSQIEPEKTESPFASLSERELQIMLMITKGQKVNEISEQLNLSPKTVNSYRYRMFSKLNIHGDVELTHLAIRHGLCNAESLASQ
ncbi:UvrY/SirA/GacA family response regulator transcription factor [Klebsiella pneumoniae]|uniref:UvrY/SirA/GacA family response regulator transcription factor n=2 Tax=Enterobacterales TaxID=91347 RepID=UPI001CD6398B|nr:UvrY/SirA/GacA family response regulator transcription factor [Klebsiella pneumoniae]